MHALRIVSEVSLWAFDSNSSPEDSVVVEDAATLDRFDGFVLEKGIAQYLMSGPPHDELWEVGVREGSFTLRRMDGELRVVVEYTAPRRLSTEEVTALFCYTIGQMVDGGGEDGYVIRNGTVVGHTQLDIERWRREQGDDFGQDAAAATPGVLYDVGIGPLGTVSVSQWDRDTLLETYDSKVLEQDWVSGRRN